MVSQTGSAFHPLVVETWGLWLPNSLEVIKVIACRASFQSVCNLHQQLSVKLSARMLLANYLWRVELVLVKEYICILITDCIKMKCVHTIIC